MGFKVKSLFCFHEYEKLYFWNATATDWAGNKKTIESPVVFMCRKCGKLKYFYHELTKAQDKLEFKQKVRELIESVEK